MATLTRKANMNRLYISDDVEPIRALLSDFHARYEAGPSDPCGDCRGGVSLTDGSRCKKCDGKGMRWPTPRYWIPLHQESRFRAALEVESQYQAGLAAELATWELAKSVIPSDYRTRHGAAYGGDVVIDGEVLSEPALDTSNLPWVRLASHETRVRDLTGQSSINGRVKDRDTLYSATVADGRTIYRIAHFHGFGDDLCETYYLPADLWEQLMLAEVRMRGITREIAEQWLAEFRGCVGTELYEFATSIFPAPLPIS